MTLASDVPIDVVTEADETSIIDLRDSRGLVPAATCEFSGPDAADLAGISYRQLDYWARQEWVLPSRISVEGVQRRMYTATDVVRLAALGHLGRSRVDVATYAKATGRLRVSGTAGSLIVWALHDEGVRAASPKGLRNIVRRPGRYVVFDTAPVVRAIQRRRADTSEPRPRRRTFTGEYKLEVLEEYDRLTAPGAKGGLLRREGLHTSHLVAWRRWRDSRPGFVARSRGAGRPAARNQSWRQGSTA